MMTAAPRLSFPVFSGGHVWLAGAGCGDAGLLTLHAHHALSHADVVYYDHLVSDDILSLAAPHASLYPAGKLPGESCRQQDIIEQLILAARQGWRVLRLKGGDPFLFGRGAEEAEALAGASIPFRIIPGISSAQGALAYSGIPLTHRDHNSAVAYLSGHLAGEDWGKGDDNTWAIRAPVLVIYMGTRRFPQIRDTLLAAGRPVTEPLAFISHGTTGNHTVRITTLGDSLSILPQVERPALIVCGETVNCHHTLAPKQVQDWLATTPLSHQAKPLLKRVSTHG